MKVLLDTHVLLWWLADDAALSLRGRALLESTGNVLFVSAVSIWELRIKQALGKIELPSDFAEVLEAQGFEALPVTIAHAHALSGLPMHHRDPFDRMLVAQASSDGLTLATHDEHLTRYSVAVELV